MAKPTKRRVPGGSGTGRVTPKGGPERRAAGADPHHHPTPSARYTPPTPKLEKPSPMWVPVLMFGLLLAGALMIVLNYLGLLPTASGEASNWWLLGGLGLISLGFVTATQYR